MAETTLGAGSADVPHEASAAGQNTSETAGDFPPVSPTASFPQELGSVKLLEVIGRGASGTVYRGHDTLLNRSVAVKFLSAGFSDDAAHRQRFLDEARMVAAVRHPNLVEIFQAGFAGDSPYLVLAFVSGATLAQVIRHGGPLPLEVVIEILDQISAALQELHRQGILHRDIKPTNILVDTDGQVRVTDLGVSLRTGSASSGNVPARPAGTPLYMAPETFEGRTSPRSDVYSLGITLFELLSGEPPYCGTFDELAEKHRREPLPDEPLAARGLPASVIEVLQRAVHKEIPFRFKSADDLARALRTAAGLNSNPVKARSELSLRVRQAAGQAPVQPRTSTAPDASGVQSVDQIIHVTRERRQDLIARKYPPLNASATNAADDAGGEPRIVADLPCLTCEYNLRGLPLSGRCPECGSPVAQSANPDLLRFAGPAFITKLRRGAGSILLGVLLSWLVLPVSYEVARFGSVNSLLFGLLVDAVMLLGAALFAVGMYKVTAADPRAMGEDKLRMLRRWTRWAVAVAVGTFVIASAGSMLSRHAAWLAPVIQVTSDFGKAALLLALFGHLRCLRQQAIRIPSPFLRRRARALSWGLPLSWGLYFAYMAIFPLVFRLADRRRPLPTLLALLMPISVIAMLAFSLFYLVFLGSLRRRLRKELTLARQIAANPPIEMESVAKVDH